MGALGATWQPDGAFRFHSFCLSAWAGVVTAGPSDLQGHRGPGLAAPSGGLPGPGLLQVPEFLGLATSTGERVLSREQ